MAKTSALKAFIQIKDFTFHIIFQNIVFKFELSSLTEAMIFFLTQIDQAILSNCWPMLAQKLFQTNQ
jgi:hypothetical protein